MTNRSLGRVVRSVRVLILCVVWFVLVASLVRVVTVQRQRRIAEANAIGGITPDNLSQAYLDRQHWTREGDHETA